ncbi:MAG: insulinase family protein [Alphaproteobacteria bacterium]|nr:insulinase family protein [Alphaproteobacteria bacterium]
MKQISLFLAVLFFTACFAEEPVAPLNPFHMEVKEVASKGGIKAWLLEDHANPIIVLNLVFKAGMSSDPNGKEGLAYMVSGLLDEGAGSIKSLDFQDILKDNAISLGFDAGRDTFKGRVKTLTENRDEAFNLLRLALTEPRFDSEPVERIRGQILASIKHDLEDPDDIAYQKFMSIVYKNHQYGRRTPGTQSGIKAVTKKDLQKFVKKHLAKNNLYIGVCGDITSEELAVLLDKTFGSLPDKSIKTTVKDIVPKVGGKTTVVEMNVPQSVALFGHAGIERKDKDFYAAFIMNHILGSGGFSSRLIEKVRKNKGLAYSVSSGFYDLDHSNLMIGSVSTKNESFAESLKIIKAEWEKMHDNGVTKKELKDAKTYLTGSFPLRFNSTSNIARMLISIQLDELGIDYLDKRNAYIENITLEDIKRTAKQILSPEKLETVVVGKPII